MVVEKYYFQLTIACQNKQYNKPQQYTQYEHLLRLHNLDSFTSPSSPRLFLVLCFALLMPERIVWVSKFSIQFPSNNSLQGMSDEGGSHRLPLVKQ